MYRCIHCGSFTGETIAEAQEEFSKSHGLGVCTSPCHWCNESVKHAAHVCANVRQGEPLPPAVQHFNDWHKR